jgi:hypothetical protein
MTEATEQDTTGDEGLLPDLRAQAEHAATGGDPDLVGLVQVANAYGLETEVVLTVSGQVLAGTLVSGRTYFAGLADAVQGDDPDDTVRGALAARYRRRAEEFEGWGEGSTLGDLDPEGPEDDRLSALPQVAYLHLRDARLVSGHRLPRWRGRLADVVGWTAGSLQGGSTA